MNDSKHIKTYSGELSVLKKEILHFSKKKEDMETILNANKYNI